jgi:hypothetical protein
MLISLTAIKRTFLIPLFLTSHVALAQTLSWTEPVGMIKPGVAPDPNDTTEKFNVVGYRIMYGVMADDNCTPVEMKHFVDVGLTYKYIIHEDPNFIPGRNYGFRVVSYNEFAISNPSGEMACAKVKGTPKVDDDVEVSNNQQGEEENEEVSIGSVFLPRAYADDGKRPADDGDIQSADGIGSDTRRTGGSMVHILGNRQQRGGGTGSTTQRQATNQYRASGASSVQRPISAGIRSDSGQLKLSTSAKSPGVGSGQNGMYSNDSGVHGGHAITRVGGSTAGNASKSLQDMAAPSTTPKGSGDSDNGIIKWLIGITALIAVIFWVSKKKPTESAP